MAEDMNMIAIDTDEGVSITNRGTSFLGKVQSGLAEAEFTKVKVGTGLRPEGTDPMEMTQLVNYKMDGLIKEVGYDEDTNDSYVTLQLKNTAIAENFVMTEAGIYVDDPDIGEILYGYIDFQDKPIPVIAGTQGVESFECKLHVYTSNIQNFTAVLSPLSDVPRKEFESEINGLKNPIFDDSGEVEDITDFSSFLTTLVSGMSIFQFFRNLKAGLKFVLNVGMTVNNLESDSTVYPLSAAQGKVLKGMVDKLNAESQIEIPQPTIDGWNLSLWNVKVYKFGRLVMFSPQIGGLMPAVSDYVYAFNIPTGYRPILNTDENYISQSGKPMAIGIRTNGDVMLYNINTPINESVFCKLTLCWITQ